MKIGDRRNTHCPHGHSLSPAPGIFGVLSATRPASFDWQPPVATWLSRAAAMTPPSLVNRPARRFACSPLSTSHTNDRRSWRNAPCFAASRSNVRRAGARGFPHVFVARPHLADVSCRNSAEQVQRHWREAGWGTAVVRGIPSGIRTPSCTNCTSRRFSTAIRMAWATSAASSRSSTTCRTSVSPVSGCCPSFRRLSATTATMCPTIRTFIPATARWTTSRSW